MHGYNDGCRANLGCGCREAASTDEVRADLAGGRSGGERENLLRLLCSLLPTSQQTISASTSFLHFRRASSSLTLTGTNRKTDITGTNTGTSTSNTRHAHFEKHPYTFTLSIYLSKLLSRQMPPLLISLRQDRASLPSTSSRCKDKTKTRTAAQGPPIHRIGLLSLLRTPTLKLVRLLTRTDPSSR